MPLTIEEIFNHNRCSILPGSSINALSKLNTPFIDIPTSLKGNKSSHAIG